MTRRDHIIQWIAYTLALLLVAGVERLIFSRFPLFGVLPVLIPSALVACAAMEGPKAGAGFGIAVGALVSVFAGGGVWRIVVCSAAGMGAGLITRYLWRQDFVGHLLCCTLALLLRLVWCVGVRAVMDVAPLATLLSVALPELLWSLALTGPVYLLFRFVCKHWGRLYYL